MDAFYILQKAVDLISLPFPGAGIVWAFDPATRSYTSLNSDLTGQDFAAILLGDPSGNWAGGTGSQTAVNVATDPVTLQLRGGPVQENGETILTLWLEPNGAAVHSLDLALAYDDSRVTPIFC